MAEIDYSIAWKRNDSRILAGAKVFWRSLGMTDEIMDKRVPELCNVAWADGKVIGVTTVKLGDATPVKCRVGFLRCAVAPQFRKHYLATFLTRDSLDHPRTLVAGESAGAGAGARLHHPVRRTRLQGRLPDVGGLEHPLQPDRPHAQGRADPAGVVQARAGGLAASVSRRAAMLTERQLECLAWVKEGKSSTDIGVILGLSPRTVDEHIAGACERLGVRTRTQAVAEAMVRGLLPPSTP